MFQLLLSSAYLKPRTFQSPMLCPASRCARSWEGAEPGQLTRTSQRGIPYHGTSCPVYKLGGVGREGRITARASVSGWWAIALCITCLSWVLFLSFFLLYSFSLQLLSLLLVSIRFYFTLVIKLFLSQPTSFTLFSPILLPTPLGGGRGEQLHSA